MFGMSLPELLVVFAIILIVFGPDKLPEVARALGKITGELKRNSDALRREFYNSVYRPARELNTKIETSARALISDKDAAVTSAPGSESKTNGESGNDGSGEGS